MSEIQITTIQNEILQSCTYILSKPDENGACLIDCGDISPIFSFLERTGKSIDSVLLTHCHYDHIYGLNSLLLEFPHLKVIASESSLLGLENDDLNMSYLYSDEEFIVHLDEMQKTVVDDNSKIKVLNELVECISTPGHDVDCMTYVICKAIFTGDSYNPNSPVFTKWRNSDANIAKKNEMLLKEMIDTKHLEVYPGHRID